MENEYLAVFSFIGKNKAVHALFLFIMSIMICAQLLVWGWLSQFGVLKDAGQLDYGDSCYQITFAKPVSKGDFESVYSKLSFLKDKALDVAACSNITMKCRAGASYNGSDGIPVLLVSFYPSFSDARWNDDLDRISNDPTAAIMSRTDREWLVNGGVIVKDGERYTYESSAIRLEISEGDYEQKLFDYGLPILTTGYNRFFSITDSISIISVQCKAPLSSMEVSKVKAVVSGFPGAAVSRCADMIPEEGLFDSDIGSIFVFVVLIGAICIADAVALLIYALSLRRREFDIYRMAGATETKIFGVSFFHMSVLVFLADLLGAGLFFPARVLLDSLEVPVSANPATFAIVLLGADLLAAVIFGVWFAASLIRRSGKSIWERAAG